MENELKPCPFCGKQPELHEWHNGKGVVTFQVCCENENCACRPFTRQYIRIIPVIDAWNERCTDVT